MTRSQRRARVNVKLLVALVLLAVILVGGAAIGYKVRKSILADRALAAGQHAVEQHDWQSAADHLRVYLSKYPDDEETLEVYARANLAVRPLEEKHVSAAIGAYQRLLRFRPGDRAARETLCRLFDYSGAHVELEYAARGWLDSHPDDSAAQLWLARAQIRQGRRTDAHATLTALAENDPACVQAFVLLSGLAIDDNTGQPADEDAWAAAAGWMEACVSANPRSAEAFVQRARLRRMELEHRARPSGAEERNQIEADCRKDLSTAAGLPDALPDTRLLLAEEWTLWNEPEKAATMLESLRQASDESLASHYVNPADFRLKFYRTAGRLAMLQNRPAECVSLADEALDALPPAHRRGFLPFAVDLFLAGQQVERARHAVDELVKLARADSSATAEARDRLDLLDAVVCAAEKDHHAAIERLRDLTRRRPDLAPAWKLLWQECELTQQSRQAAEALARFVSLSPADANSRLAFARDAAARRPADWREVLRHARAAADLNPDLLDARLLVLEARLNDGGGRLTETELGAIEEDVLALQKRHADNAWIRSLHASVLLARGRDGDAIDLLERTIDESPRPFAAAVRLARIRAESGRIDEAVAICRRATEKLPDDSDAWIAMAELLQELNRPDDALAALQTADERLKGRDRLQAGMRRAGILLRLDRREEAVALLKTAAAAAPDDIPVREALLDLPEIAESESQANALIDEIRRIEGDNGIRWRAERARLLARSPQWQLHRAEILDELLAPCLRQDPGHELPALVLGQICEREGRWSAAEDAYRAVVRANPAALNAAHRLLLLLEQAGRFAEAEAVLEAVHDPAGQLRQHQVTIACGRGKYAEAQQQLERLIEQRPGDVDLQIMLARIISQSSGDVDAALAILDRAKPGADQRTAVSNLRVRLLHTAGRRQEALAFLDDEVRQQNDMAAFVLRASYLAELGEFEKAQRDYARVKEFPESGALGYQLLGALYAQRQRMKEAIAEWKAGLDKFPGDLSLQISLARAQLSSSNQDDRAAASRTLDQLLKDHPANAAIRLLHAQRLLAGGDATAAAAALEQLVEAEPGAIEAQLKLIQIRRAAGDIEAAHAHVVHALGRNPSNPLLLLERASLELALGQPAAARTMATAVLDGRPADPAIAHRAREIQGFAGLYLLDGRGDRDALVAFLASWQQSHPDAVEVLAAGGELLLATGEPARFDAVAEVAEHLIRTRPGDAAGHMLKARLEYCRRNYDASETAYRSVLNLAPDDVAALNDLAWLLTEGKKDPAAALPLVNRALTQKPADVHLLDTRGVTHFRLGQFERGRADLEQCLSLVSQRQDRPTLRTRARVLFHLGRILAAMDQAGQARARLVEAREIDRLRQLQAFGDEEQAELDNLLASLETSLETRLD